MEPAALEKVKTDYMNRDRSVNIREYIDKQGKLEKSGLENIDIVDRAKSLGKDDFLKLLVTQLSHQDPTQPVQDQQFIAQMAQFSSLEQMQNISNSVHYMADRQAFGLVGKFVMGIDSETGKMESGLAEAILYDESNKPYVRVNGRPVSVNDVKVIGDPSLLGGRKSSEAANAADASNPAESVPVNQEMKAGESQNPPKTEKKNKEQNEENRGEEPVSFYDDVLYTGRIGRGWTV